MIRWRLELLLRRFPCYWNGHDIKSGDLIGGPGGEVYNLTPDYCGQCLQLDDETDLHDGWNFKAWWEAFKEEIAEIREENAQAWWFG